MFSSKRSAAILSIIVIICLIILKVTVGVITGSLSTMAQATDSFLDLFAVAITYLAIRVAVKPADEEHPFGHGKAENIGAVAQAGLIFIAGVSIIYTAVMRIVSPFPLAMTEAAIGTMIVSIIASIFLSRHLIKVARLTDSPALEANAHNIAADVYSAGAVLVGLLVVRFTNLVIIDSVLAILVALFIFKVAYDVTRHSLQGLVDVKLPEEEEAIIKSAIIEHVGQVVEFHALRTRKAGSQRYIELHLVMPRKASVVQAHDLCDHLEDDIGNKLANSDVTIHVEPCDENCERCPVPQEGRRKKC